MSTKLHPFCKECGWRKGGLDSWDGHACKCGHYEPPLKKLDRWDREVAAAYDALSQRTTLGDRDE